MPRGKCWLVALAFLSIAAPSVARAQETMSYLSPNEQYTQETINNGGRLETYLNVTPPLPPGPGLVCRRIVIPIDTFLWPCSFFNYCPDSGNSGVIFVVRVRCRHINPVPPPPQLPHATNATILEVLRTGTFQVTDVSTLPNSINTVVAFGIPAGARYGLPSEFNGTCPANSVLITSPALQSLGNKSLCVQTVPTPNNALLQSQATQTFANLVANPDTADTGLPALRDLIESVMGTLVAAAVCRTDDEGHIAVCLRAPSAVDFPVTLGLTTGLCPVLPRLDLFNACVSRSNQTPTGCGVIACVEALNDRGVPGCVLAIANRMGALTSPHVVTAATIACKLIARRQHLYTAPRNGTGLEICRSTQSTLCTRANVVQAVLADVRRQAPFVLQGPPSGSFAADRLTTPMPINPSNPSRLYYLGGYIQLGPDLAIPTNTSNPITVSVGNTSCVAATNTANQDHLLVGIAENCIYQDGTAIKSIVYGSGTGRFALLNELIGPTALGTAQQALRNAVQATFPPPPPPPPRPRCDGPCP
jgi:hypothetical protein